MAVVGLQIDHEVLRFFGEAAFEDWKLFEAHFDLSDGFALLVLLLPGAAGATVCEQALAERLAKDNLRLERIRFSSASEIIRLGEWLLDLNPDGVGGVWISLFSPERADDAWMAACRKMFAVLNLHRNRILQALPVPLIFVGEPWLQQVFREAAPDFWSVRSTVVRLLPQSEPDESRLEGTPMESQKALIGVEAAGDPDYTLQQAHRFAHRPDLALQRAELLMRAAAGFCENARLELAESCLREGLDALANASEMKQQPRANVMRAAVLNNLATVLSKLGHREEALAKSQEAVRIYEQLAQARPDMFLTNLAVSLNTLVVALSHLDRREETLAKARESVRIRQQLAQARPGASVPDLAGSLNNLANALSALGRREEALTTAQEAERIYEQLAKTQPDTILPDLAMSLSTLANKLSDLGRHEEALAKAHESVRIRRQLAQARPDAFMSDFAMSLGNLANILSDLGRREEALAKAQEAFRIYEQLAKARPDAFDPDWARSIGVRGKCLKAMGDSHEAAAASLQALKVLAPHFLRTPATHASLMTWLLDNYLEDTKAIQQEPDRNLVGPIQEQLEKLNQSQSKG